MWASFDSRRAPTVVALALGLLLAAVAGERAAGAPLDFDGTAWAQAARPHGIDPALLYAIGLTESRRTVAPGRTAPWPWVLRTPTGGYWFDSREAAARGLRAVLEKWPPRRIDVGAAQVNLGWHRSRFTEPERLLELDYNLEVAAAILADAVASTRDPVIGVGRYHHWVAEDRTRAYGRRVWGHYRAVTFGTSDPSASYLVTDEAALRPVAARLAER